jgi:aspartyl aminopeptidase
MTQIESLIKFLNHSPTAWHAVVSTAEELKQAGFTQLREEDPWQLAAGGRYFSIRNGSSIAAFILPESSPDKVHVIGAHTDSPGFKLKPRSEYLKENMVMLGVEMYGSPLITSWFNRDLGIAGRVIFINKQGNLQEALVRLDKYPVVIPQLAIHLDRQVNENGLLVNKQEHLAALAAIVDRETFKDSYLEKILSEQIQFKNLLSTDLFLFPLEPAARLGYQQQMIAGYRIDNLNSAHAALTELCQAKANSNTIKMICLWDNEEVGSETFQGAGSPFLSHTLERITLSLGLGREDYFRLITRSICLSVDQAHAMHPNYAEKHEARHPILMQKGIVIKFNAQQRYASDARSASIVMELCQKNNIPFQQFVTRSDIPCGTTIGPIHAHTTGMPTVDIGCGQLSMHSCRELASCQDYLDMCTLLGSFFEAVKK